MLNDLPKPPDGKIGWPWTLDPPPNIFDRRDREVWPRISIVTPSYNQAEYLEETIRSVLMQGYPNLEYIVVDGASTDNSVEIIREYEPWLSHWVSEPDRGQAHALNKGFSKCTGQLLGWINSDDLLTPGSLLLLANVYRHFPESILLANVINVDNVRGYKWEISQRGVTFKKMSQPWRYGITWHQPGTYFTRSVYDQVGPFDETLQYVFDWDWMCRALQVAPVHYLRSAVAQFRLHGSSKTVGNAFEQFAERPRRAAERYLPVGLAENRRLAEAAMEILYAEACLTVHNRKPSQAYRYLVNALRTDVRVVKWPRYWTLWVKGLLPAKLLHLYRVAVRGL